MSEVGGALVARLTLEVGSGAIKHLFERVSTDVGGVW
ncbi:hypothetical protein Cfla_1567 [Cellulomonas flavigena DSM 20109]|uniref:Uncharacterized protein n=1 Tax=Cellulomonas flavigena (strain ATCC 482 / DSM 20109 / BCRC 11376 / JCM 18109 / NBRC 3775 / NCIMB 8073 / NRS 134) TaxID=446466 RepID=D5UDQ7_CELFN|nr:hypothetical protein Cfla_1567 [Cellulomonas flavigena DSM 20109]